LATVVELFELLDRVRLDCFTVQPTDGGGYVEPRKKLLETLWFLTPGDRDRVLAALGSSKKEDESGGVTALQVNGVLRDQQQFALPPFYQARSHFCHFFSSHFFSFLKFKILC
jgi:hypothetical protein